MVAPTAAPAAAGVVIAGAGSGTGKTTVATGLMAALSRSYRVAPFKVGPDFIDPSYHALATGRPGRNLDSFMCGNDLIGPLYAHGCQGADIAVVEGVMGLFDGRITSDADGARWAPGSTAEIAGLLGLPVIVVLNARGISATAGALVHGLASYNSDVNVAGVILNQVGSPRHAEACTRAIEGCGIPVVGAIPRVADVEVPSRHLGLVTAAEQGDSALAAVEHMADLVAQHVDTEDILRLASTTYVGPAWNPQGAVEGTPVVVESAKRSEPAGCSSSSSHHGRSPRIALAGGPAFTFVYAELPEILQVCGADVIGFDPLTDSLPTCDGLIIPGGFPEEHLEPLTRNQTLLHEIRDAAANGMPIYAECAGLLVLCGNLDGAPMAGVVPRDASMSGRLTLGYREATARADSVLFRAGDTVRGHEFHHTTLTPPEPKPVQAEANSPQSEMNAPQAETQPAQELVSSQIATGLGMSVNSDECHHSVTAQQTPGGPASMHATELGEDAVGASAVGHVETTTGVEPEPDSAWSWLGWKGKECAEGFVTSNVHASYLHMHPAAIATNIATFVAACSRFGHRNES